MRNAREHHPRIEVPPASPPPGPGRRTWSGSLAASFAFAFTGLVDAATRDRNMRIHLAAGVLASCFAALAPLSAIERGILLLCVALVVAAEAVNSAIEAVVDLVSPGWDPRARVAKDAAAGAVLVLAAGAVLVFLTIALPVHPLALALARPVEAGAALGAAIGTGLVLVAAPLPRAATAALLLGAAACLGAVALRAQSPGAVSAAALLLAVAAESARRRHATRR